MSETSLRIIPTDPGWAPRDDHADAARLVLEGLCPNAETVDVKRFDQIAFVDQGSNFGAIRCALCGAEATVTWWQDEMDRAFQSDFTELTVVMPCCAEVSSLNDLDYEWPAGFARFVLMARIPGRGWLSGAELAEIATTLRHPVRQILARY